MLKTYHTKLVNMITIAMLSGVIILFTFTGIGYIPIGPGFSVSILTLPVLVGAIFIGPVGGLFLGLIFGITSFLTCILGMDALGVILFGISPWRTAIMCIVPRIIMGFLVGLIFRLLQKIDKTKVVSYAVASLSAPILNTILFLSTFWLMFHNFKEATDGMGSDNLFIIIFVLCGVNALIEAIIGMLLGTTITKVLDKAIRRIH